MLGYTGRKNKDDIRKWASNPDTKQCQDIVHDSIIGDASEELTKLYYYGLPINEKIRQEMKNACLCPDRDNIIQKLSQFKLINSTFSDFACKLGSFALAFNCLKTLPKSELTLFKLVKERLKSTKFDPLLLPIYYNDLDVFRWIENAGRLPADQILTYMAICEEHNSDRILSYLRNKLNRM